MQPEGSILPAPGRDRTMRLSARDIALGAAWYARARAELQAMAVAFDRPLECVVAVCAALSPRRRWQANLNDTARWFRGEWAGMRAHRLAAEAAQHIGVSALRGPKVRAFALAILGDPEAVVVDRHVARALNIGVDMASGGVDLTAAEYREAVRLIRRWAKRRRTTPSALQAALWIKQRGAEW